MYEKKERPGIIPLEVKPKMKIQILEEKDLHKIQEATLNILSKAGIRFPSLKALKIFAEAGAEVDFDKKIVKLSSALLEKAMKNAPRAFRMASRSSPELDLYLDGNKIYFGTDGTGVRTIDFKTGKERSSLKKDVEMMALIADYLPCVSFYWPMVSAQDVHPSLIPLHELEASFSNTEKHVHIISCVEERSARFCVEMASVVAGGREKLRKRPPLSLLVCTASPLGQDEGSLEAALIFAEAGLPVGFMAMPMMGSTAPASVAGALVVGNAEVLSALCLVQIAFPGAPVYYALSAETMNPWSGRALGGAFHKPLLNIGRVEIGHFHNLPVMAYYGSTGSREIDWRAGKDNSIDALFLCLSTPELFPALGLLETYSLLRPEKILFDYEIFESLRIMLEGIEVNEETLAEDEIFSVGQGGHYLDRNYTLQNLRKLWRQGIANDWSWSLRDFRNPHQVAREKINWILENHKPQLLENEARKELLRIIAAAEKEFKKT